MVSKSEHSCIVVIQCLVFGGCSHYGSWWYLQSHCRGFRKALREDLPKKVVAYHHPHFLRDAPEQVKQIVILKKFAKRKASRATQDKLVQEANSQPPVAAARAPTSLRDGHQPIESAAATGPLGRSSEGVFGPMATVTGTATGNLASALTNQSPMMTPSQHRLLQAATAQSSLQELQWQRQLGNPMFDLPQAPRAALHAEFLIQQQLAAAADARNLSHRDGSYGDLNTSTAMERQFFHQQPRLAQHQQQLLLQAEQRRHHALSAAGTLPVGSLTMAWQQQRQRIQLERAQVQGGA